MKTKIFTKNKAGKIEFTEKQLKELLDEIYNEGYNDGKRDNYVYTTPYRISPWWSYTTSTSTDDNTIYVNAGANISNTTTATNSSINLPTDYNITTGDTTSYKYKVPKTK